MECMTSSLSLMCPSPTLQLVLHDSAPVFPPPILGRAKRAPIAALNTPLLKELTACIKTLISWRAKSPTFMPQDIAGRQYTLNE